MAPKLSLVAPTMGKPDGILRMLDSLIYQAPPSLLVTTELVVFLNRDPDAAVDVVSFQEYLLKHASLFHSTRFITANKFHLTAEESAFAATAHATGEYLWIVGDKRVFLPEGLAQLANYIQSPATPCAYFNSVWHDANGHSNAEASTFFSKNITTIPYKMFVQSNGINFMATNMGTWIFQRHFLDPAIWQHVITNCGPHFSHVTTLLATMGGADVTCHAAFLAILEAKAYHAGNTGEWDRYSKLAGTYRYYAWTFGLVRQFRYLIDRGVYSYADVRRSMCSEKNTLVRQVDEIYKPLTSQIWRGWLSPRERIKQSEFDEILLFLAKACPERAIIHGLLRKLYAESHSKSLGNFIDDLRTVSRSINIDHFKHLRLSTLVVGQIGDMFIRLHPRGYLRSRVSDNDDFMLAYKLADPPLQGKGWRIIDEAEMLSSGDPFYPHDIDALFPVYPQKRAPLISIRGAVRLIGKTVMSSSVLTGMTKLLPKSFIAYVWRKWL